MPKTRTTFSKYNQPAKHGGKHEKTKMWENLGDFFTQEGAERAKNIMMSSDDEQFMKYYGMLIELFKPKLQRTDLTSSDNSMSPVKRACDLFPPTEDILKQSIDVKGK